MTWGIIAYYDELMKTRIFHTTNAGLYFCSESSEILVDGIHDAGAVGYYPMSDEMKLQMNSDEGLFAGIGALLFTHMHADHCDEKAVEEYCRMHPGTAAWGPGLETKGFADVRTDGDKCSFRYGDFSISAYKTKHSGSRALDVPHYSLLLKNESCKETFFAAGDALLEPGLADELRKESADCRNGICTFVMAYQLAERKSKEFLEELKPGRIILIHQPRPEDDAYNKVSRIMSFAIRETADEIAVEIPEPMSWIE